MSIGPCLCGDPYCSSCGNPGAAAREEWIEHLDEITSDFNDLEAAIFENVGLAAVQQFRKAQEEINRRQTNPDW